MIDWVFPADEVMVEEVMRDRSILTTTNEACKEINEKVWIKSLELALGVGACAKGVQNVLFERFAG